MKIRRAIKIGAHTDGEWHVEVSGGKGCTIDSCDEMKQGVMKLPLPSDVEFHEDIGLLIYRPRGLLDRAAINKIISVIGELEFTLKKPFNRFLDASAADRVDLNLEYIRRVSLYRRRFYGNRPPIKTAILATDSTVAEYGRLHASLTEGSPINVRVFQDRKEAAQWLGAPIELLTADGAGRETI
jgi:hypothetical protein